MKYREYKACCAELEDAKEMKASEKDSELSAMIDEEISVLSKPIGFYHNGFQHDFARYCFPLLGK